jgi:hypothetical protein
VLQEGSRQIKRWSGPKTGQRGPQRCCKRAADRSRGGLVLRQSASRVDESTHRYSCKRAVVGGRRVKRDPHRCCKRAADRSKRWPWSIGSPPAGWTTLRVYVAARGQMWGLDGPSGVCIAAAKGQQRRGMGRRAWPGRPRRLWGGCKVC